MAKSAASLLLLSALAMALAGCWGDKASQPVANVYPKDYKDEIIATLRKDVFSKNETTSVSDAFVSDPALQTTGNSQLYVTCVRYTAHGTAYNLAANATRIGYFYGGHLNQLVPASPDECAKAAYKPFPELDKVCIGTGCR
jgi:hypothetical protein